MSINKYNKKKIYIFVTRAIAKRSGRLERGGLNTKSGDAKRTESGEPGGAVAYCVNINKYS